jgi:hypothetical protein
MDRGTKRYERCLLYEFLKDFTLYIVHIIYDFLLYANKEIFHTTPVALPTVCMVDGMGSYHFLSKFVAATTLVLRNWLRRFSFLHAPTTIGRTNWLEFIFYFVFPFPIDSLSVAQFQKEGQIFWAIC